jgi:large subunit ribosomal protein L31
MRKGIHPNYRYVIFQDTSAEYAFLSRSCATTRETATWTDGKEYPVIKLDISHKSHPFFTGKQKLNDTAGRVDKFKKKYGM